MFILDFIKSLFIPKKMQKYRNWSVLISLCIFIIAAFAIQFPVKKYYEKNTSKFVEEKNLYGLQAIKNIPTAGSDLVDFVDAIKNTGLKIENGVASSNSLGLTSVTKGENVLGIITKNSEEGKFYFDGVNTLVNITDTLIDTPTVEGIDGGIIINNDTSKPFMIDGVSSSDSINVYKVSVNNRSKLVIDGTVYETTVYKNTATFKISEGFLYVDEVKTNFSCLENSIIYFVPNYNVEYFEVSFSYMGEDSYLKNIIVTIDLKATTFALQEAKEEYDLENNEYFFLSFYETGLVYQAHPNDIKNITHNEVDLLTQSLLLSYSLTPLYFDEFNVSNFGEYFTNALEQSYIFYISQMFSITSLFYMILLPLIICVLYFLMFKNNGRMKTMKEYYNIGGVCNILAFVITFIALFFVPEIFSILYVGVFGMWYLYCCYKINNSSELI